MASKLIKIATLYLVLGLFISGCETKGSVVSNPNKKATVNLLNKQYPIPAPEIFYHRAFNFMDKGALQACADEDTTNMPVYICYKYLRDDIKDCRASFTYKSLSTKSEIREYVRDYADCVYPGYFCDGKVFKKEEELTDSCGRSSGLTKA